MTREEILQLPLNRILECLGYSYDKTRSSQRNPVMIKDGEKLVINRHSDGNYLYFNIDIENDRGNFFSFCKNRNLHFKEVITAYLNDKVIKKNHSINISNTHQERPFKEFENFIQADPNNPLIKARKLDFERLNFKNLRQDKYQNLIFPLYDFNGKWIDFCGFNRKLSNPILKSKSGEGLDKPLKSIIKGKKGIEVLKGECPKEQIRVVIISESIIDSLSLSEIARADNSKSIIIGTGGNLSENGIQTLKKIISETNSPQIILGFDNDLKGQRLSEKISKELGTTKKFIPKMKDFSDDLVFMKTHNLKKEDFYQMPLKQIQSIAGARIENRQNNIKKVLSR